MLLDTTLQYFQELQLTADHRSIKGQRILLLSIFRIVRCLVFNRFSAVAGSFIHRIFVIGDCRLPHPQKKIEELETFALYSPGKRIVIKLYIFASFHRSDPRLHAVQRCPRVPVAPPRPSQVGRRLLLPRRLPRIHHWIRGEPLSHTGESSFPSFFIHLFQTYDDSNLTEQAPKTSDEPPDQASSLQHNRILCTCIFFDRTICENTCLCTFKNRRRPPCCSLPSSSWARPRDHSPASSSLRACDPT